MLTKLRPKTFAVHWFVLATLLGCGNGISARTGSNSQSNVTTPAQSLKGYFDGVDNNGVVGGWALSTQDPSLSISTMIYIDSDLTGGLPYATVLANQPRPDVDTALKVTGDHGIQWNIPAIFHDGNNHVIHLYALDGTSPFELGNSPLSFNFAVPTPAPTPIPTPQPTPTPTPAPTPVPCASAGQPVSPTSSEYVVTLKAFSGNFVTAECGGDDAGVIDATRAVAGGWETFYVKILSNSTVSIRSSHGRFVSAENGGGNALHANRTAQGVWETFTLQGALTDGSSVGFKTYDNTHFVSARINATPPVVDAEASSLGSWEGFVLHVVATPVPTPPPTAAPTPVPTATPVPTPAPTPTPDPNAPKLLSGDVSLGFPSQAQHRQAFAAYDDFDQLFFVATGAWGISGAFVGEDGNQIGSGFTISQTALFRGAPSIAYSTADNVFLVVYYGSLNDTTDWVYGRLITYSAGGTPLFRSDEIPIGTKSSRMTDPPGITYVPSRNEFVVAWQGYEPGGPGIDIQRVSTSGTLIGASQLVAYDGQWIDEPSIAYNPDLDQFVVAFSYAATNAEARIVVLDANAQVISGPTTIEVDGADWLTKIEYNPDIKKYFMVWSTPNYMGRFLNGDATPASPAFQFAPGFEAYDGMNFDYNPVSKTYLIAFQAVADSSNYILEMRPDGTLGAPEMAIAPIGSGNFDPRVIASHKRKEWLFMTTRDFNATLVKKIGSGY